MNQPSKLREQHKKNFRFFEVFEDTRVIGTRIQAFSIFYNMILKVSVGMLLFCSIGFSGCKPHVAKTGEPSVPPLRELFAYPSDSHPFVFAHRGGSKGEYPENAIETFDHTFRETGAFMEVDPRYTKDGIIVLFHDETLDRSSNGSGKVSDHTYAELKELKLLSQEGETTPFSIPTLEESFQWARGKSTVLLLDRKDVTVEDRVEEIQRYNAHSFAMVSAYNYEEAKRIFELDPTVMMQVFMPDQSAYRKFEETGIPWQNAIVSISKISLTKEHRVLIESIHSKGAMVVVASYGMIDHPYLTGDISKIEFERLYLEIFNSGVDIIQCNLPIEVNKIIRRENL